MVTEGLISKEIFRAYDIRGIVDRTLREVDVFWIGKAIGTKTILSNNNDVSISKVIVARDGRLSSNRLIEKLKLGINSTGCEVIDLGMVPTPVLYFATYELKINSAVMLTGSHNPPDYNGLKIILDGNAIHSEEIASLRDLIINNQLSNYEGDGFNKIIYQDLIPEYISYVANNIRIKKSKNLLKIVVDCGNGVVGVIAEKLFTALGIECIPLYSEVDGNFPNHHPDPLVPENLTVLISTVIDQKADLGIAFDGDGDRLGVVDHKGNIIWPDRYLMLFIKDLLTKYSNKAAINKPIIIYDVKSTNHLEKFIQHHGGVPLMWKTGHSLIKAKMRETKALLAGEMSGHVFFKDRWFGFDDALYTACRLLELISIAGKSLHELCDQLPENYCTPELMIAVTEDRKQEVMAKLIDKLQQQNAKITTIDGIRLDFSDGWGLIRASNTTANLIARFEGIDPLRLEQIKQIFRDNLIAIDPSLVLPF